MYVIVSLKQNVGQKSERENRSYILGGEMWHNSNVRERRWQTKIEGTKKLRAD